MLITKPWITHIIRFLLGTSFAVAGFSKLFPLKNFISQILAYQLPVSPSFLTYIACLLIGFEIWIGLSILLNSNLFISLIGCRILLISMIPITIWGTFHQAPSCGCYGNLVKREPIYATIEDALLLAITFLLIPPVKKEKQEKTFNKRQIFIFIIAISASIYGFLQIKTCLI